MKKRFLFSLTLVLILSLLLFVACQNSSETSGDSPQNSTTAEPTVTTTSETSTTTTLPNVTDKPNEPINEPDTIKLMTFNLRYDTVSHPVMSTEVRGAHLMEVIQKYMPDSVGFNEATNDWMNYLRVEMKKMGYEYIGLGRDFGVDSPTLTGTGNEHTPIFYRADKFDLIDSGNFWLSTTPEQRGTSDWNSACTRICSYVVLKNKTSGETYAHFGTHLDHVSEEAQYNSVNVIETYIRAVLEKHGDIGIVLSGDFNAVRFDESNPSYIPNTYNAVTAFMDDSRDLAETKLVDGATWSGYQNPLDWERGYASNNDRPSVDIYSSPIDYIFLRKGAYSVSLYTVVNDVFTFEYNGQTWTDHPISDHYGVYCEVKMIQKPTTLITDDSKVVKHQATVEKSDTIPTALAQSDLISENAAIASVLSINTTTPITNLLKNDDSVVKALLLSKTHGYWEIKITMDDLCELKGFSFTTSTEDSLPSLARVFVSSDGTIWEQVGPLTETLTENSTYYILPETAIRATYVKFIFSDCDNGDQLVHVGVYGKLLDTGRIHSSDITLIAGPKAGDKEGYEKMFDGDTSTKFYIRLYSDGSVPAVPDPVDPIYFSTANPVKIVTYTLTNADDTASYTGRIPRQWTLYGSTTGEEDSYVIIDRVTSHDITAENLKTFTFEVSNPDTYPYYKLVFDTIGTSGNMQFSEIVFYKET